MRWECHWFDILKHDENPGVYHDNSIVFQLKINTYSQQLNQTTIFYFIWDITNKLQITNKIEKIQSLLKMKKQRIKGEK